MSVRLVLPVDASARPVQNLIGDPQPATASIGAGASWVGITNGTAPIVDGWRMVTPSAAGADCFATIAPSGGVWKPNTTYTILGQIKVAAVVAGYGTQRSSIWPYFYDAAPLPNLRGSIQAPNAAGIYDLRHVFTTPATWTGTSVRLYSDRENPTGWRNLMLVEGDYSGPYLDGTYPNWRWTGTQYASAQAGYPYTLESIAGTPSAVNLTPGSSVAAPGLNPLDGRTLYVVHDVITPVPDVVPIAIVGAPPTGYNQVAQVGGFCLRHNTAGGNFRLLNRAQSLTGAITFPSTQNQSSTTGRHVSAAWMDEGDLGWGVAQDGTNEGTLTQAAAGGVPQSTLGLASSTANSLHVAAYLFRGTHNAETRKRVTAWLARRYGAPIPAGY